MARSFTVLTKQSDAIERCQLKAFRTCKRLWGAYIRLMGYNWMTWRILSSNVLVLMVSNQMLILGHTQQQDPWIAPVIQSTVQPNANTSHKHYAVLWMPPLFIFFLLKGKRKRGERYKVIYINRTYMCVCIDDVGWGKGPHRWRDNQTKKNWYFLFCNQTLINESLLRSLHALLFTYCGRIFINHVFRV